MSASYGVSPAFIFSRHTTDYTAADCCDAVRMAHELGFSSFQPEIFHGERLEEWIKGGAAQIAAQARAQGVNTSQFVAHFLMHGFSSRTRLKDRADVEALKRVVDMAAGFTGCHVLTVPLARYQSEPGEAERPEAYAEAWALLRDKVVACLEITQAARLKLALELLPFSLLVNSDGFLRLAAEVGSRDLGVNLDTGHAWAQREVMELLPSKLRGRIFGVHLKDNNSDVNQPLAPGKGTIPWAPLLQGIRAAGYTGTWDIEIGCPPEQVAAEYTAGLNHLKSLNIN